MEKGWPEPGIDCGPVVIGYRRDGTDILAKCGTWAGGTKAFCDIHFAEYSRKYPQGWTGYPGDTCRHGKYTGGSGVDWMCSYCEFGED